MPSLRGGTSWSGECSWKKCTHNCTSFFWLKWWIDVPLVSTVVRLSHTYTTQVFVCLLLCSLGNKWPYSVKEKWQNCKCMEQWRDFSVGFCLALGPQESERVSVRPTFSSCKALALGAGGGRSWGPTCQWKKVIFQPEPLTYQTKSL